MIPILSAPYPSSSPFSWPTTMLLAVETCLWQATWICWRCTLTSRPCMEWNLPILYTLDLWILLSNERLEYVLAKNFYWLCIKWLFHEYPLDCQGMKLLKAKGALCVKMPIHYRTKNDLWHASFLTFFARNIWDGILKKIMTISNKIVDHLHT